MSIEDESKNIFTSEGLVIRKKAGDLNTSFIIYNPLDEEAHYYPFPKDEVIKWLKEELDKVSNLN